jgi:hypothetical protein
MRYNYKKKKHAKILKVNLSTNIYFFKYFIFYFFQDMSLYSFICIGWPPDVRETVGVKPHRKDFVFKFSFFFWKIQRSAKKCRYIFSEKA